MDSADAKENALGPETHSKEDAPSAMESQVPLNDGAEKLPEKVDRVEDVDLEKAGGILMKEDVTAAEFHFAQENNKLGLEIRGIERVLPEDRHHKALWQNLTLWGSANFCLSTMVTGALGRTIWVLATYQSILIIFFTNLFTCALVAYMSTYGPKLGLRQMVIARFSFGWFPSKFVALINCIACIGWSMVNVIVGGTLLTAISNGKLPVWGSILLLAFATIVVGVFGYKIVHYYELVAWAPLLIIFIIVLAEAGPYITNVPNLNDTSLLTAGSVLSYMGALLGFAFGWASYASDYNVNMPEDSNRWKVAVYTFFGLFIPFVFIESIGIVVASTAGANEELAGVLADSGIIGLTVRLLQPLGGFGTFCLVLLALSTIANNVPNDYSLGLSLQVAGPRVFMKVPRWVWTLIGSAIYVVIACVGANNLTATLENFLLVIGYWGTIYVTVTCIDCFIRDRKGWPVHDWNAPDKLPYGFAASAALVLGIVGAVLGMAQVWYIGPVGALFGPYGGDVGWLMAAAFAAVVYIPGRMIESKKTHRM
ncbi:purine-cytosine permease-like protein [Hyaloraphidium curvatum]|nr:purine-cytosine permease-like protein [Hyaloraphidium curvatum]